MDSYQLLVVYLLLFLLVGIGFIFVHLVAGMFLRPFKPESEKLTIYECGEPTIGSAWVQFDLRFYVVALLFVIFDVEVAFFFPWAVVFGKANELAKPDLEPARRVQLVKELVPVPPERARPLTETEEASRRAMAEFEDRIMKAPPYTTDPSSLETDVEKGRLKDLKSNVSAARQMAWIALFDIAVFFGVLLVGFAYLWKRGDLEWVRSVSAEKLAESGLEPIVTEDETLVGAGADH